MEEFMQGKLEVVELVRGEHAERLQRTTSESMPSR